jgi:hypothetical protein
MPVTPRRTRGALCGAQSAIEHHQRDRLHEVVENSSIVVAASAMAPVVRSQIV